MGTIPVSLDQVQVSGVARNDRHTAKYLFLLGANDHVLPTPGQGGGILNEDDRDELAQRGIELAPTGMDQMGIELQNLYAALAQPRVWDAARAMASSRGRKAGSSSSRLQRAPPGTADSRAGRGAAIR